jgi:hypothetical protein
MAAQSEQVVILVDAPRQDYVWVMFDAQVTVEDLK